MKWIYRLFTLAMLSVALAFPFFMDNKQGEPMLSMPKMSDFVPDQVASNPNIPNPLSTKVYKWQDEHGSWHYGDTPPVNNKSVATLEVNTNTNIIQGMKPEPKAGEAQIADGQKRQMTPEPGANEDFLTLDRAMNIMNDAKAARDMMEARNKQLNTLVGEQP